MKKKLGKIVLGNLSYGVWIGDNVQNEPLIPEDGMVICGSTNHTAQQIWILSSLEKENFYDTLTHESMHMLFNVSGISNLITHSENEETLIRIMVPYLIQLIPQLNKILTKWESIHV